MKFAELIPWGVGLVGAGVAGYFVWSAIKPTESAPVIPSVTSPATSESRSAQGYANGRAVTIDLASVGNGKFMQRDAAGAFLAMQKAAAAEGVNLQVISGFRTMEEQTELYNLYVAGKGNLAARPGYSNHQQGLSADLNTGGWLTPAYRWLLGNASRFGFRNDVKTEHWHWTWSGGAVAGLGALNDTGNVQPAPGWSGTSWLVAGGLTALVVYQTVIRKDQGPHTL